MNGRIWINPSLPQGLLDKPRLWAGKTEVFSGKSKKKRKVSQFLKYFL
jgi:hypothetical protein